MRTLNGQALLRAELDAWFARAYSLTRDVLRYIFDPADAYGADFPRETCHVLKGKETAIYGKYTGGLVLEESNRLKASKSAASPSNPGSADRRTQ